MIHLSEDDRAYVLERLDRPHILDVADKVREQLVDGYSVEASYMPGDGTWYSIVFAPLTLVGGVGGGTQDQPPTHYNGRGVLVCYQQREEMFVIDPDSMPDLEWVVSDRLTVTPASQLAIAELLKEVFA